MPTQQMSVDAGRNRPVTEQGRETRESVIRAALRHFAQKGYLDAKVEDIVADAGVAYGTFYKYFHSKRDLVRAILTDVYSDIAARRLALIHAPSRPVHERAYPDILHTLRFFYHHRATLSVLDVALGADPELARYMSRVQGDIQVAIAEMLDTIFGEGMPVRPEVAALAAGFAPRS
jgi:AcrR family transcriptional regulator